MLNKKKFLIFIFVLLVVLPWFVLFSWPNQRLHFIACNVGQGDAILITKGSNQVLIDGGPNNKVLSCLSENMPFWDRTIELVVNTHPDKDHLAGLIDVVERYRVKEIVSDSLIEKTAVFQKFHQQVVKQKIKIYSPQKGDIVKLGDLKFMVLWPEEKTGDSAIWQKNLSQQVLGAQAIKQGANDYSIVLHLQYRGFDALLTGDITKSVEEKLIEDNHFSSIEILKVAHHGSKFSSSEEFLKAVKPKIAVISVGKNPWGHPTKEVLNRLKEVGAEILRTDKQVVKLTY